MIIVLVQGLMGSGWKLSKNKLNNLHETVYVMNIILSV